MSFNRIQDQEQQQQHRQQAQTSRPGSRIREGRSQSRPPGKDQGTDSDSWTSNSDDDETSDGSVNAGSQISVAKKPRKPQSESASTGSLVKRKSRNSRKSRRDTDWAVTRGVDRMLVMMGSKVEEPTIVEKLQMHRDIPYVISGYLQLGLNIVMIGTVLVIMAHVLRTIQHDVNSRVQEYSTEILQEIGVCSKQYSDNRCDPKMRVPAMEQACIGWENCMNRDPTKVGRAKVSAETLAEIINGFIEPISLKTMMFFVSMFFGTLFISNFAFGAYRQNRVHQQYVSQSGGRGRRAGAGKGRRGGGHSDRFSSPSPPPAFSSGHLVAMGGSGAYRRSASTQGRRDPGIHPFDRRRPASHR
ncbi:hypothetical protein GQ54DRAFT_296592 [Martensiomyces pterosporus]|nr:hypothetical protein GQ54DRAFT_296592 [Martensiomyces pterosporus]